MKYTFSFRTPCSKHFSHKDKWLQTNTIFFYNLPQRRNLHPAVSGEALMTYRITRYLLITLLLSGTLTILSGCSSRIVGIENHAENDNCIKVMNVPHNEALEIAGAVSIDAFHNVSANGLRNRIKVRHYHLLHGKARSTIVPRLIHSKTDRANLGFAYEISTESKELFGASYTGFMATRFFEELAKYIEEEAVQTHTICDYVVAKTKGNVTTGSGTCWLVDQKGYHVTCAHVVGHNQTVLVVLPDGTEIKAKVVLRDPTNDIAILKTSPLAEKYEPIPVNKSEYLPVGEEIFVIGYPTPFYTSSGLKISSGLISSQLGIQNDASEYQLSAFVNGGNSGGPVVDATGRAVAIASSKLSITGVEGTAYAKKSNLLPLFFKQLDIHNPEAGATTLNAKELHKKYKYSVFRVKSY